MTAQKEDEYVRRQRPAQREVIQKLRSIIFKECPGVQERMKWGVLGYSDGACYIVALKDHVNIGFSLKQIPKEKWKLLDGIGKETGHIEIREVAKIDEKRVSALLKLVMGTVSSPRK